MLGKQIFVLISLCAIEVISLNKSKNIPKWKKQVQAVNYSINSFPLTQSILIEFLAIICAFGSVLSSFVYFRPTNSEFSHELGLKLLLEI